MFGSRLLLFAIVGLFCPSLVAQYTAGKIIFKNVGPYAQVDLETVAQLHSHDKVSRQVVQEAAQRLIDTGYFDDVGATLEGPVASINVIFTLKPLTTEQMTPVGFENFVWLTSEERDKALRKRASALPRQTANSW